MKFLLSLFAKRRYKTVIRDGCMYRLTYKDYRLIKEERLDENGGFSRLNDPVDNSTLGDRTRTDLYHTSIPHEPENFLKKPDIM